MHAMYAIAILRYRRPLEEILPFVEPHRAYLRTLKDQGILIASGPFVPRTGGALLLKIPSADLALLDRIREEDPFTKQGLAQYEIWPWDVNLGNEILSNQP